MAAPARNLNFCLIQSDVSVLPHDAAQRVLTPAARATFRLAPPRGTWFQQSWLSSGIEHHGRSCEDHRGARPSLRISLLQIYRKPQMTGPYLVAIKPCLGDHGFKFFARVG